LLTISSGGGVGGGGGDGIKSCCLASSKTGINDLSSFKRVFLF
jgi:hypothetical protein